MRHFLFIILLLWSTSVFAADDYIRYEVNQIIEFDVSIVPRNVDIYVDIDGDGRADIVFVSPVIESHPAQVKCEDTDCEMFVEMQEFIQLQTEDVSQPYIYIVSKDYIFHRRVGKTDKQEFIFAHEEFDFAIKDRTGKLLNPVAKSYVSDPELLDPDGTIDWDDPYFSDQFREPTW